MGRREPGIIEELFDISMEVPVAGLVFAGICSIGGVYLQWGNPHVLMGLGSAFAMFFWVLAVAGVAAFILGFARQKLKSYRRPPPPVAPQSVEYRETVPTPRPLPIAALCQQCGVPMVPRTARRGAHAGRRFWGCINYPRCRQIVDIKSASSANEFERQNYGSRPDDVDRHILVEKPSLTLKSASPLPYFDIPLNGNRKSSRLALTS